MKIFIVIIWTSIICLLGWSALLWRPIWSDGAFWIYEIIRTGDFFYASGFHRFITYLPQLATVLYVNADKDFTIQNATTLYSLGYGLIGIFWFTLSNLYLWRKLRTDLILVNILLYLGIVYSAQAFYVSIVGETAGLAVLIYWMLLLETSPKKLIGLSAISLALFFSYELAFMFFGLYSFLFLIKYRSNKQAHFKYFSIYFGSLVILFCILFVLNSNQVVKGHVNRVFITDFFAKPESLNLLSWVLALLFPALVLNNKKLKYIGWLLLISLAALGCYEFSGYNINGYIYTSYLSRTSLIPKAVIALMFICLMDQYQWKLDLKKVVSLIVVFMSFLIYSEWKHNMAWSQGMANFKELLVERKGCQFLKRKTSIKLEELGFLDWVHPYSALILQGNRNPDTIFFTKRFQYSNPNPCLTTDGKSFVYEGVFNVNVYPGPNITFGPQIFNTPSP